MDKETTGKILRQGKKYSIKQALPNHPAYKRGFEIGGTTVKQALKAITLANASKREREKANAHRILQYIDSITTDEQREEEAKVIARMEELIQQEKDAGVWDDVRCEFGRIEETARMELYASGDIK